jgi:hypothetical protein
VKIIGGRKNCSSFSISGDFTMSRLKALLWGRTDEAELNVRLCQGTPTCKATYLGGQQVVDSRRSSGWFEVKQQPDPLNDLHVL